MSAKQRLRVTGPENGVGDDAGSLPVFVSERRTRDEGRRESPAAQFQKPLRGDNDMKTKSGSRSHTFRTRRSAEALSATG